MPGARLGNITKLANGATSSLGKSDTVIVIEGANDINKNETNVGLAHLRNVAEDRRNTNIMVVPAPHRHDLLNSSCVNKEIVVFNRKLHKVVKSISNMKIIQSNLNRDDFTHHGMHLKLSGKEKVAKLLGENIKQLTAHIKQTPLITKWREDLINNLQKEAEVNQSNDVNKGTKFKSTLFSTRYEETQTHARKPPLSITIDQNNVLPRSSNRIKKTPTTMNEDFLWITRPTTRARHQPVQ